MGEGKGNGRERKRCLLVQTLLVMQGACFRQDGAVEVKEKRGWKRQVKRLKVHSFAVGRALAHHLHSRGA